MSGSLTLRPYQAEAIDNVFKAWGEGVRRPAVVLPTGAGKTVVFAALIKEFRSRHYDAPLQHKGLRVIVLVHRDELADQAIAKIRAVAPHLNVGKVKAKERQTAADVMVCSVQTLATRSGNALREVLDWEQDLGKIGLIITDECHHAAAASYQKVYAAFPDALQLGVTATMARGDGVGLGSTWEEVVFKRSILWMMLHGYLAPVRTVEVMVEGLDTKGVKTSRGDVTVGALGQAMEDSCADEAVARAYVEHAKGRPGIVFTPTVATAEAAMQSLNDAGIMTQVISGETPTDERHQIINDFRTGEVQVLANCMVLTEGFDAPWAEVAVIARPTMSAGLYTQMVGRVLRTFPGKADALVLDMVGASRDNRLCTLIDLEPGAVRSILPGESLEEAAEREAEESNAAAVAGSIAFELKHKDVSMFEASARTWLRTPKGVYFIRCEETTVFLWPTPDQPGLWDVCTTTEGEAKWLRSEHTAMDIGTALAWGEVAAEDTGEFSAVRSARWLAGAPLPAQEKWCARRGLEIDGMRRGAVEQLQHRYIASRLFDQYT